LFGASLASLVALQREVPLPSSHEGNT